MLKFKPVLGPQFPLCRKKTKKFVELMKTLLRELLFQKGKIHSGCNFYSLEEETLELVLMLITQRANVGITHHLHGDTFPGDHGCVGATEGGDHCICQNKVTMTEIPEINSIYIKSFI